MATILIADDNREGREMLARHLGREGYRVVAAADGAEALALAQAEKPDLVITDVVMPTMDGYEFVRQLRADPLLTNTPVLFYTASYIEPESRALAEACGVFRMISKPASRETILRAVEEGLQATGPSLDGLLEEAFDREHRRLLTNRLAKQVETLEHEIEDRKRVEEDLRETRDRLNGILNSIDSIIFSVSAESFQTLFMNPAAEKIYGRPVSEFYTEPNLWRKIIHPDDWEMVERDVRRTFERGAADHNYRILRPDGEVRHVNAQARLIRNDAGAPLRIDGIVTDVTEQVRAQEQIKRQVERLTALRAIDIAISSSFDLRITLSVLVEQVISSLGVDAADVLLLDPRSQMLEYAAGRGFRTPAITATRQRMGADLAGHAALDRRLLHVPSLLERETPSTRSEMRDAEEFVGYCAAPLLAKGKVVGVLECFHRAPLKPDREWLGFLETLAGQAAIAIDNATLFDGLQRSNSELIIAYDTTLEGWSRALDLRDKETEGHTQRVTELAVRLAQSMGMSAEELAQVRRGALLHDIGKLGIPDSILLKPGALTPEEWEIMRRHTVYAYEWLSPIVYLRPALDIPYCHHEKWDGTGYPRGLKGMQIPLAARVFAIVDVWDALRSDRPYRQSWPAERVRDHIQSLSGSHFDPEVVEAFLDLIDA